MLPRVMHVVVAGDVGGAERLLVDLATRPEASGATHAVALMTPNPALAKLFADAGLEVFDRGRVRENPLAYLWRSLGPADTAWLARLFADQRSQVAHLHTFASHVVGTRAALRVGIPVLRTEHHVQYFVDPSTSPFTRWSLHRAHSIVAISRYVRDFVVKTAPYATARLRVVRNGVDADYFAERPPPGDARPFTFGVVCRLEPWKEVDLVLHALTYVEGARLDVVGDGSERSRLEKRSRELGLGSRVRFLGYQRDPREAVAACDACVSSSRDEPLGLSVLEALSSGRPVVAFAGGGIPEIVREGETGWLVGPRSAEALAARMSEAAGDRGRARAMGRAARAFVDAECRIETMCEGYARAYADLLG